MVEVTQADRELFITLSNADGQMAERILCGQAFTWEVEQIARHRSRGAVQMKLGDTVRKKRGYPWPGVIVADFTNLAGERRIVVECTVEEVAGALHIYNPEQLEVTG